MFKLKESFADYYRALLGPAESEAFFAALKAKKTRRSVRVNTLKFSKAKLKKWLKSQGYTVTDNPFSGDGIDLEGKGKPLALKLPYHAGFTYPQDSSSMFGVEFLDAQPNEIVIDLTAAPGGKSTHIAAKMRNTGLLISNDWDRNRLKALRYNFERLGVKNAAVFSMLPHKIAQLYPEAFDRVLLDPSCSGEGLWVTPKARPEFWNPKALKRYASEQFGLLKSAFILLKPGGRLVYSTCTLNPIENDSVVQRLMKEFPQAEMVKLPKELKKHCPKQIAPFKGIRFWPHKTETKGFFCIALTKKVSLFPGDPPPLKELPGPQQFQEKKFEKSFELDREQVEALFSQKKVPLNKLPDGEGLAVYEEFPLGPVKVKGDKVEFNLPKPF